MILYVAAYDEAGPAALSKAAKKISKAIDKDDYEQLRKAVEAGRKDVGDAIES